MANTDIVPRRAVLITSSDVVFFISVNKNPQLAENIVKRKNFIIGNIGMRAKHIIMINVNATNNQKFILLFNNSDFILNAIIKVTNNWNIRFPKTCNKNIFLLFNIDNDLKRPPIFLFLLNNVLYIDEFTI
jgi:hypothetical protein